MSWTTSTWGVKRCMKHAATCLLALAGSDHVSFAEGSGNVLSSDFEARSVALIGQIGNNPWPASLREAPSASQRFRGRRNRTARVEDRGLHRRRNGEGEPCLSTTRRRRRRRRPGTPCMGPFPPESARSRRKRSRRVPDACGQAPSPTLMASTSTSSPTSIATATSPTRGYKGHRRPLSPPGRVSHPDPSSGQVVSSATKRHRSLLANAGSLMQPRRPGSTPRVRAHGPWARGWRAMLWDFWRVLVALEGGWESSWGGRAFAHVLAGALASSHPLCGSLVVGLALWVSCAKRLRLAGSRGGWRQVARVSAEVALSWYCHALPHGLGMGRPLRGNFGSGKVGDLLGAMWHFLGQGVFVRLVASSSRLVGVNVLEANGILMGISCLGNALAGSRMRCIPGNDVSEECAYQLRGFFSRTNGIFGDRKVLSFPFDVADTLLALQGILSATEREMVSPSGAAAEAFREFAGKATNTFDAHSLGTLGARNIMGMGFVRAQVRMFGRPAVSLGWTEKASNMCMVGDPICGSLVQKLLDPTCVMLKGRGHFYDAYLACIGCLDKLST